MDYFAKFDVDSNGFIEVYEFAWLSKKEERDAELRKFGALEDDRVSKDQFLAYWDNVMGQPQVDWEKDVLAPLQQMDDIRNRKVLLFRQLIAKKAARKKSGRPAGCCISSPHVSDDGHIWYMTKAQIQIATDTFNELDINHNGEIEPSELTWCISDKEAARELAQYDANGDGIITLHEFLLYWDGMLELSAGSFDDDIRPKLQQMVERTKRKVRVFNKITSRKVTKKQK